MYLSNSGEALVRPHEVFHFKCLLIARVHRRKRVFAAHGQQLRACGQRMTPRSVVFGLLLAAHWRCRELSLCNTPLPSNDRSLGSMTRLFRAASQPQLDSFHVHSAHDPTLWLVGHPTLHSPMFQARAKELSKACTAALGHDGRKLSQSSSSRNVIRRETCLALRNLRGFQRRIESWGLDCFQRLGWAVATLLRLSAAQLAESSKLRRKVGIHALLGLVPRKRASG